MTAAEVQKYGMSSNQGVAIDWVNAKGPFGEAGFEVGDIILRIDNVPITGLDGFVQVMGALKPNQKISVLALDHRTGNMGTVTVVLGAESHFRKASENFMQDDSKGAAAEIREGASFLKMEANQAGKKSKETIMASIQELEKLANDLEQGAISSVAKLEEAFDRAYHSLASNHD